MESKRSYRQQAKRLTSFFYLLPIVTMLMSSQLSGCIGVSHVDRHSSDSVDRHSNTTQQKYEQPGVPYPVPTVPQPRGSRATEPWQTGACPTGDLYYCDHRKRRCGCVNAHEATSALRLDAPLR